MSETQEQKIHKYIIKSSPYGQLSQVLKDLQKVSQVNLSSPHIIQALQQYNQEHLALIGDRKQQYVVTMPQSRLSNTNNQYVNQLKKKKYTVNHITGQVVSTEDYDPQFPQPVIQILQFLEIELSNYVKKYFRQPNGHSVFIQIDQTKGVIIHLGLTGKNVSLGNFYTGQWISKWTITTEAILGQAYIKAHFFQAGNVQLHQKKAVQQDFQFSKNVEESAKKIIKIIQTFEGDLQKQLSKVYEQMPVNFFKNLRRVAPVTKTKMSWNINAIKMNKNLMQVNNQN